MSTERRITIPESRLDQATNNLDELRKGYVGWQSDEQVKNCYLCEKKFTMFNRKHHCRNCGKIICGSCSEKYECGKRGSTYPVRVCKLCYNCVLNSEGKESNDCKKYMKLNEVSSTSSED